MQRSTALFFHAFLLCASAALAGKAFASDNTVEFPFKANDRVAWIGSSSTRIGTWCRTMEFLLRTRHPELKLAFSRGTTGGGTFATGIKNLPIWLTEFKPTFVLFNYGGNDAGSGPKGLLQFKQGMQKCYELAQAANARAQFITPQSADVRVADKKPFENRKLYAETMLEFGKENGWGVYDTHHPLEAFQLDTQKDVPDFTINRDNIHLTDTGYVAWGYYLYELMNPPTAESVCELSADGKVVTAKNCRVTVTRSAPDALEFTRADDVLPLIPPDPLPSGNSLKSLPKSAGALVGQMLKDALKGIYKPIPAAPKPATPATPIAASQTTVVPIKPPETPAASQTVPPLAPSVTAKKPETPATPATAQPAKTPAPPPFKVPAAQVAFASKFGQQLPARKTVPLEKYSQYMLKVTGLEAGRYEVSCEGKPVGRATEKELADGVNLNTLLLDSKNPAPWNDLMKDIWIGKRTDEIGKTNWKFKIEKM